MSQMPQTAATPPTNDGKPTNGGIRRLHGLLTELEASNAPAARQQAVRCALKFKRSWIELAQALAQIRQTSAYRKWGHDDLMSYCSGELGLRAATVDKLLVSYATVNRYAPGRLTGEQEGSIPSYQALDYLARVTAEPRLNGKPPRNAPETPPQKDVLEALHTAVFDEGQSARLLKERFDPIVRPMNEEQKQKQALRRLCVAAARLLQQLNEVEALEDADDLRLGNLIKQMREQTEALTSALSKAN